jgi:pyrophosphatase PpaX
MIKAVIFDLDDTLIRTFENVAGGLKVFAERKGLHPPGEALLKENYGKVWKDCISTIWPQLPLDKFATEFYSYNGNALCPPVKGVHQIVDILSKKYVLGLVTGRPRDGFMSSLMNAKIDFNKFAFMLTHDELQKSKSDPEYFNPAFRELEKMGIGKKDILYVGDSVHDLEAAQKAGIRFAGVLTGPSTREQLMERGLDKNRILPSVMDLPAFIENNGF